MKIKKTVKQIVVGLMLATMVLPQGSWILALEGDTSPTPTEIQIVEDSPASEVESENLLVGETVVETEIEPTIILTPTEILLNEETEVEADYQSEANSGNNSSLEGENTTIESGEAFSYANIVNLINTNLINSNLKILIINNFDGEIDNVDLNKIWQQAQGNSENFKVEGNQLLIISKQALAKLSNSVKVIANSGNNTASAEDGAIIVSGNAVAIANVVNLVNVQLIEAKLFIGVVNVDGARLGDIVLPNPEAADSKAVDVQNSSENKSSELNQEISSHATSGNNNEIDSQSGYIRSGDALSGSSSSSIINDTVINQNQTLVVVNLMGQGYGNILNRLYPGSIESMEGLNQIVYYRNDGQSQAQTVQLIYRSDYEAQIDNQLEVSANSGGNQIGGSQEAAISSGQAIAWANILNVINSDFFGGSQFYSWFNIFGDWRGDLVLAYPDLGVNIQGDRSEVREGDSLLYKIKAYNLGYDDGDNVRLNVRLPQGLKLIKASELAQIDGQELSWVWNKLKGREAKELELEVRAYKTQQAAKRDLIQEVNAAESWDSQKFLIEAVIESGKVESDNNNNRAVEETTLFYPVGKRDINSKIEIEGHNNVADFIWADDVVTFEFNLINSGEGDMHDSHLIHEIYDESGYLWSRDEIKIGDIKNQQKGKVVFGIPMNGAAGSKYFSRTMIIGVNENDEKINSNTVDTDFLVKAPGYVRRLSQEVEAADEGVLGLKTEFDQVKDLSRDIWLYLILFFSSSSFLGIEIAKKIKNGR